MADTTRTLHSSQTLQIPEGTADAELRRLVDSALDELQRELHRNSDGPVLSAKERIERIPGGIRVTVTAEIAA